MMPEPLPAEEIRAGLGSLDGFELEEGGAAILKRFSFKDFARAFAFMAAVATHAEKTNHHPEWSNVYNRVEVRLSSHDVGGVTERDLEMARFMNDVASSGFGRS
ncbi:MAG: 4a-hydroxytetrahydrobiopterin dehydratase [Acidimicrobiales bacterium]